MSDNTSTPLRALTHEQFDAELKELSSRAVVSAIGKPATVSVPPRNDEEDSNIEPSQRKLNIDDVYAPHDESSDTDTASSSDGSPCDLTKQEFIQSGDEPEVDIGESEVEQTQKPTTPDICSQGDGDSQVDDDALTHVSARDLAANPTLMRDWKRAAMEIPIPQLLQWIATHKPVFSMAPLSEETAKPRNRLCTMDELPEMDANPPFVGLSTSPGVLQCIEDHNTLLAKFRRDSTAKMVGHFELPVLPSTFMNTFKLHDGGITLDPLPFPDSVPSFIAKAEGKSLSCVREKDLQKLEGHARRQLTLLSNVDATLGAVLKTYPTLHAHPDQMFLKALFRISQAFQALVDTSDLLLQQVTVHRRDTAINARLNHARSPVTMEDQHVAALRYAPYAGARYLFEPQLLESIRSSRETARRAQITDLALDRMAHGDKVSARKPQAYSQQKRKAQTPAAQAYAPAKKSKAQPQQQSPSVKAGLAPPIR